MTTLLLYAMMLWQADGQSVVKRYPALKAKGAPVPAKKDCCSTDPALIAKINTETIKMGLHWYVWCNENEGDAFYGAAWSGGDWGHSDLWNKPHWIASGKTQSGAISNLIALLAGKPNIPAREPEKKVRQCSAPPISGGAK